MKTIKSPLSSEQTLDSMFLMIACQMLIDNMDRLENTSIYRHELKNNAKRLFNSLITYTNINLWKESEAGMDKAADQLVNMAVGAENIIRTMMKCNELIPSGQQPLFWREVNLLAQRYRMPFKFAPDGEFVGTAPTMKAIVGETELK